MLSVEAILQKSELSQLQLRRVFRQLSYPEVPDAKHELTENQCLLFWLIMLVWKLKFLSSDQQQYLLDAMLPHLGILGQEIDLAETAGVPMLVIGDARFATWYGRVGYLDLQTGESIEAPPQPILESTAYNLAVLFFRNKATCLRGRQ